MRIRTLERAYPRLPSLLRRRWRPYPGGPNILSTDFAQPLGSHIDPRGTRGYYIDLRVKAFRSSWPQKFGGPGGRFRWVPTVQFGLGCHERYIAGEGDRWLDVAIAVGDELMRGQEQDGVRKGGWVEGASLPHTFPLPPPWISALVQGQAASLLVRLGRLTDDDRYADAAREALRPMRVPSADGGVVASLNGGPFFEEYPTDPPSFVLNGAIFALWGCYDVATAFGDAPARDLFDEGLETLASSLHRFDTGYWSRYDLFPHPVMNIASLGYHRLHIEQLRGMALLAERPVLAETADRFARYHGSKVSLVRASIRKVAFRLAVPRRGLSRRPPRDPARSV